MTFKKKNEEMLFVLFAVPCRAVPCRAVPCRAVPRCCVLLLLSTLYLPLQAKAKELELLCSLKNVELDPMEQEQAVGKLM